MSLKDKFTIDMKKKKREPYYSLFFEMDSNDGDYISDTVTFSKDEWDKLPEFFFLMLAYLDQGYSGKFSHGKDWGDYYGHHWEDNKHGLYEEIESFADEWSMMCHSDWGRCHSYSEFQLSYYDEENRKHAVTIPSIDDEFETEEEMIKAIKDACIEYFCRDCESEEED